MPNGDLTPNDWTRRFLTITFSSVFSCKRNRKLRNSPQKKKREAGEDRNCKNDADEVAVVQCRFRLSFWSNCAVCFQGSLLGSQFPCFSGEISSQMKCSSIFFYIGFIDLGLIVTYACMNLWILLLFINVQLTEKLNSLDTRVSNLESVIPKEPTSAQVFFFGSLFFIVVVRPHIALR